MKTKEQIEAEIKKLQDELVEIENKTEYIKIPELKIEISQLKEWTKPYNEIVIPKDCELVNLSELLFIWENEKYRKVFFKEYLANPSYIRIWCKQLWNDKKNNWSRWLCLYGNLNLSSGSGDLAGSDGDGRVAFVRRLK